MRWTVLDNQYTEAALKRLNGDVQNIDPKNGNHHHQHAHAATLRISTKSFDEPMNDSFIPCKREQRNGYSQCTTNNERPPPSPTTMALITQNAGQGLNDHTTERGCYPDQRRQRFGKSQRDKKLLMTSLGSETKTGLMNRSEVVEVVLVCRVKTLTEPLDRSTDQTTCRLEGRVNMRSISIN